VSVNWYAPRLADSVRAAMGKNRLRVDPTAR